MTKVAREARQRINDEVARYWAGKSDYFDLLAAAVHPVATTLGFDLIGQMEARMEQDKRLNARRHRNAEFFSRN